MPNRVTFTNDEFYISYMYEQDGIGALFDMILSKPENFNRPETAIVIREDGKRLTGKRFLILYGDHTEAYAKLVPDLGACIEYFLNNLHLKADTSDMPKEVTVR